MSRNIFAWLEAAVRRVLTGIHKSAEKSARVQDEVNAARSEFYQKYPENFIRRGIL